jgi:hypothetical protein
MRAILMVAGVIAILVALVFVTEANPAANVALGVLVVIGGIRGFFSIPKQRRESELPALPAWRLFSLSAGLVLFGLDRIWRGHYFGAAGIIALVSFQVPEWIRRYRENHGAVETR